MFGRILIVWLSFVMAGAGQAKTDRTESSWSERVDHLQRVIATADSLLANGRADLVADMLPPLLDDDGLGAEVLWPLEQRLGLALQAIGRLAEALPHLERAVLWAQGDPVNHRNLAHLLLDLGKRGRAFSEYRDACSLAPDDWAVRVEFCHVLMDYGQEDRVESLLNEADTLCPECPDVNRARVRFHLLKGQYDKALPAITALHEAAPSPETREQFALILLRTGQPDRARSLLVADWPTGLSGIERRVLLEADQRLGDDLRATSMVEQTGGEFADADLWGLAALICYETGRDDCALTLVDRAIALSPRNAALRNNRVAVLLRLGRQNEADAEWAVVLDLDPSLADNRTEEDLGAR